VSDAVKAIKEQLKSEHNQDVRNVWHIETPPTFSKTSGNMVT
jgi:hypothetical protein